MAELLLGPSLATWTGYLLAMAGVGLRADTRLLRLAGLGVLLALLALAGSCGLALASP